MPRFSTNKRSYTASDRSHAHLIRLHSTTHGEVSQPPLLWIGNRAWIRLKSIVAAATIQIMKLAWVTYLGALSRINAILIPRISAHPPILAPCKVHRPWALFREGTVYVYSSWYSVYILHVWLLDNDAFLWVLGIWSLIGIIINFGDWKHYVWIQE